IHYTIGCRWLDVNQHSPLLNSFKWWTCVRDDDGDDDDDDGDDDDDNDDDRNGAHDRSDNNRSDDGKVEYSHRKRSQYSTGKIGGLFTICISARPVANLTSLLEKSWCCVYRRNAHDDAFKMDRKLQRGSANRGTLDIAVLRHLFCSSVSSTESS
ncbi:hypothetical protein CGCVW01_v006652, partial [Colletotrichum viniferum]